MNRTGALVIVDMRRDRYVLKRGYNEWPDEPLIRKFGARLEGKAPHFGCVSSEELDNASRQKLLTITIVNPMKLTREPDFRKAFEVQMLFAVQVRPLGGSLLIPDPGEART
ncbi:unnamed protein product [Anisakis simplex]|uniref:Dehydrogenase n=1 Tax=Anisakis simplex TaxID=6269 RepID=A0A0M3KES3_ANISI|nr:unnamed protein product [Anisakis simplex]